LHLGCAYWSVRTLNAQKTTGKCGVVSVSCDLPDFIGRNDLGP
jgi:hypothetical protein